MTESEKTHDNSGITPHKKRQVEKERLAENIEFGKRIKSLRQDLDLTFDALSRLTKLVDPKGEGISRVSLSRYENGDFSPGLREIRILSKAFRKPLSFLAYGRGDDPMQFMSPSLEEALDEQIYQVVIATLIKYGLIDEMERFVGERESPDFERLLEQARKGA